MVNTVDLSPGDTAVLGFESYRGQDVLLCSLVFLSDGL